jgi:glycerophosphoryl diester phosphodiesterase family protein
MTLILGSEIPIGAIPSTTALVVPAGVTAGMIALFTISTAQSTPGDFVLTKAAATFTRIDDRAAGNMVVSVHKGTGLAAGDVITISSLAGSVAAVVRHYYQDEYDFIAPSLSATVRTASVATSTTGSFTPAAGQRVVLVALERTTATPTTVSSVTTTAGDTVTQIGYQESASGTASSTYFGTFVATTNATRIATVTYSGASGNGYGAALLTTPIAAGGPIRYVASPGTLATGTTWYVSSGGVLSPSSEVRAVPTGYPSVTAMLATNPFYVSHRGGSIVWPEMSLHAYTQSVYRGVGALELCVAKSSDGVFFGLHDDTLDRTSGTTGFVASEHTWAEIQALSIAPPSQNPAQPSRPYMSWDQLISAYYTSHVIFVDPKGLGTADRSALMTKMNALPHATDRFVAKYYGVSTSWVNLATANGYQSWGYFYEADLPSLAASQVPWTILGMEYGASQSTWDTILAFGKPVIGHITPDATSATAALTKGARGLQVSGVTAVIPLKP